jgi:hypothetical protein
MNRPGTFEFILATPLRYPLCHGPVTEKTLRIESAGLKLLVEVGSCSINR